jgi:3-deoxy-7-phosphoheptulonate synthase
MDAKEDVIKRKLDFYNIASHILGFHLKKEVLIVGRIAGQYAKPRSHAYETINNGIIVHFVIIS